MSFGYYRIFIKNKADAFVGEHLRRGTSSSGGRGWAGAGGGVWGVRWRVVVGGGVRG